MVDHHLNGESYGLWQTLPTTMANMRKGMADMTATSHVSPGITGHRTVVSNTTVDDTPYITLVDAYGIFLGERITYPQGEVTVAQRPGHTDIHNASWAPLRVYYGSKDSVALFTVISPQHTAALPGRLRVDPSATPQAVSVASEALPHSSYYQGLGALQSEERIDTDNVEELLRFIERNVEEQGGWHFSDDSPQGIARRRYLELTDPKRTDEPERDVVDKSHIDMLSISDKITVTVGDTNAPVTTVMSDTGAVVISAGGGGGGGYARGGVVAGGYARRSIPVTPPSFLKSSHSLGAQPHRAQVTNRAKNRDDAGRNRVSFRRFRRKG